MNTQLQSLMNRLNNAHKALLTETDPDTVQEILRDIALISDQIANRARAMQN